MRLEEGVGGRGRHHERGADCHADPHTDAAVAADRPPGRNQTVTVRSSRFVDHIGSRTPYSVTIGSGRAAVLHGGTSYAGTWKRAGQGSITSWDASGGGALTLAPGRTWVILVPAGTSVGYC